jgi:hypothetical protein
MTSNIHLMKDNLFVLLTEIRGQAEVGTLFPSELQSLPEQVEQIREWIEDVGEYGLAYESFVSMLEQFPFQLSGGAAIKLLEVGLLVHFKTELPGDAQFDSR